ncbi:MAG: hypothetical protein MJB14_01515 [Spirochaetes bacterium]|nr:hypothetical protein [Spirochaetota bacterium]
MIQSKIEDFHIKDCPHCGKNHHLKVSVFREILPNNMDNDIRVPEYKKINLDIICPQTKQQFNREILIQEDRYSRIIKLKRPD